MHTLLKKDLFMRDSNTTTHRPTEFFHYFMNTNICVELFLPLETEDTVEDECKKIPRKFFFRDEKSNFVQIGRNLLTTGDPLLLGIN